MSSDTPGKFQMFVDNGGGFQQELSVRTHVFGDGQLHTYRVVLFVRGRVTAVRVDPLDRSGVLSVRRIALSFADRNEAWEGSRLAAWRLTHEIEAATPGPTGDVLLATTGNDPRMILTWDAARSGGALLLLVGLFGLWLIVALFVRTGLAAELLAVATPAGFLFVLHHEALRSWWFRDDPCLLATTVEHGIWAHFVDPNVWRPFSSSVLMPWSNLSLGLDWHLFGLEPAGFYAHHLLAFAVLLVAAYGLLRVDLAPAFASLALSLFVLSVPATAVARQLMNRHYLEGLLLMVVSLALHRRALATGKTTWSMLGALAYGLAATAKEVFVPMFLVVPFISGGTREARRRGSLQFGLVAMGYGLWRVYMLGWDNAWSGYSVAAPAPKAIGATLGLAEPWQVPVFIGILAAAVAVVLSGSTRRLALAGVVAFALAIPLLAVSTPFEPRHLFLPLFVGTAAIGGALQRLDAKLTHSLTACAATALVLCAVATLGGSRFWQSQPSSAQQQRTEGAFILDSKVDGVLLTDINDTFFLACLRRLRVHALERSGGPGFCGDTCLCPDERPEAPRFRSSGKNIETAPIAVDRNCDSKRSLQVEMRYSSTTGRIHWRFGPYRDGRYELIVLFGDHPPQVSAPVPVAAEGDAPFWVTAPLRFVVKYRSPEGWLTYSPVQTLAP